MPNSIKKHFYILLCLYFISGFLHPVHAQISTIAGTGTSGFSGDGGPATAAKFSEPFGVAVDSFGNIYIADYLNSRIRKVDTFGIITTFAGTSTAGFSGDGGPATAAEIRYPYAVVAAMGNIYICDAGNNRVRKVDASGIITTIAGNGSTGITGDGGPATAAGISNLLNDIAVDPSGNVYISYNSKDIRKVDISGIITTFAGSGTAGFCGDGGPATLACLHGTTGVYADAAGNVYIADGTNARIRKVDAMGIITTIAGTGAGGFSGDGGPATAAEIGPSGIKGDNAGNLYICGAGRVRKIDLSGIISTIAGNGTAGYNGEYCNATYAELNDVQHIAIDMQHNLYIADYLNSRVRKVICIHAPYFTGGHTQYMTVCAGTTDSINSLMAVVDSNTGQGETWSVLLAPVNGTLWASFSTTSTGGVLTTTGMYYTPTTGYSGNDSFKVEVTDCTGAVDTTTIYVSVTYSFSTVAITGAANICAGAMESLSA